MYLDDQARGFAARRGPAALQAWDSRPAKRFRWRMPSRRSSPGRPTTWRPQSARTLPGPRAAFAVRMTKTARSLGMTRTTFRNASGLPNPGQVTTARDMATLGLRIQRDFPDYYPYFSTRSFIYKGQTIRTHNRLLGRYKGADGIKTGYIRRFRLQSHDLCRPRRQTGHRRGHGRQFRRRPQPIHDEDAGPALPQSHNVEEERHRGAGRKASGCRAWSARRCRGGESRKSLRRRHLLHRCRNCSRRRQPPCLRRRPRLSPHPFRKGRGWHRSPPMRRLHKHQAAAPASIPAGRESESSDAAEDDAVEWPTPASAAKSDNAAPPLASAAAEARPAAPDPVGACNRGLQAAARVGTSWNIQVGAYPKAKDARRRLDEVRALKLAGLRQKTALAIPVSKGKSKLYRARFLGFSEKSAKETCRQLTKHGVGCLHARPSGLNGC